MVMLGTPLSGCFVIVCGLMFCKVVGVSGVTVVSGGEPASWLAGW